MNRTQKAKQFRAATTLSAQGATNAQALSMAAVYDLWAAGIAYGGENQPQIVRRPAEDTDRLYRVIQPHTAQEGWEPENVPALWEYIDLEHAGTIDDPIPAVLNMEYFSGKYYTEDGKLYLCTRDSGMPLAYLPSQLVGTYFEEVSA